MGGRGRSDAMGLALRCLLHSERDQELCVAWWCASLCAQARGMLDIPYVMTFRADQPRMRQEAFVDAREGEQWSARSRSYGDDAGFAQ